MSAWDLLPLGGYLATLGLLAGLGVHRLALLRALRRERARSWPPLLDPPVVTVQLPVYNERHVVARLLRAACNLEYPAGRLEIQVLDDSTDVTREIVGDLVRLYRRRGIDIQHLRRRRREGFKAGALAAGLARARGELVAIFDADFVPPADFLRRTAAPFADPAVGMVQARWAHLNRGESLLTRVQAICLDAHFGIEHRARQAAGLFFNFNGTAGVWRRRCLEDAGGWQADTLTEDLDLSYRAQLRGWRFVYLDDVQAPAELPAEMAAFQSQQHRWAKGSAQTARKLLPSLLTAPIGARRKLAAALHLGANAAYLLLLALAFLLLASLPARQEAGWFLVALELPLFLLGTGSVCAFYVRGQRGTGAAGPARACRVVGVMVLGIALAVNNGRAVLEGLRTPGGEFRRTPKRGAAARSGYATPGRAPAILETCLAAAFLGATGWALREGTLGALPVLSLFAAGFALTPALRARDRWRRGRRAAGLLPHLRS